MKTILMQSIRLEKQSVYCRGGIEANSLHKVFLPYISTKEKDQGRGIGLYLSKMIFEEHFGRSISIDNEKEGACFTLSFPKLASKEAK